MFQNLENITNVNKVSVANHRLRDSTYNLEDLAQRIHT